MNNYIDINNPIVQDLLFITFNYELIDPILKGLVQETFSIDPSQFTDYKLQILLNEEELFYYGDFLNVYYYYFENQFLAEGISLQEPLAKKELVTDILNAVHQEIKRKLFQK